MKKFFNRLKGNKKFIAALIIVWYILASLGLILFCSMQVKASAYYNDQYFPMQQNQNNLYDSSIISAIEYTFDSENNYIFVANPSVYSWGITCNILVVPKSSETVPYAEIWSNGYQFSIYNIGSGGYSTFCYVYYSGGVEPYGSDFSVYQGLYSSLYSNGVDYVSNFRLYTNNVDNEVVLKYGADEPNIIIGEAIPPHEMESPVYTQGHSRPENVPPNYTINNYSWTTYNNPPVDNSSIESLLESIFDILSYNAGYLQTNISNEFDNLIFNIKGLIDYLGETLQYYGDLIISNIQNGIQNFYDNMANLVQPIFEKLSELTDLFTNPFDSEEFEEQLNDSSFYSSLDTTITSISTFGTSLTHATEPENLTLTLNLSGIGWGVAEIDFNWIKPFRNIIRVIIGCVLIYWLAIEVITGLNNVIGSGGDNEE